MRAWYVRMVVPVIGAHIRALPSVSPSSSSLGVRVSNQHIEWMVGRGGGRERGGEGGIKKGRRRSDGFGIGSGFIFSVDNRCRLK